MAGTPCQCSAVRSAVPIFVRTGPWCEQTGVAKRRRRGGTLDRRIQFHLGYRLVCVHAARMATCICRYRPGPAVDAAILGLLDTFNPSSWHRNHGVLGEPPGSHASNRTLNSGWARCLGAGFGGHGCLGVARVALDSHHRVGHSNQFGCGGRSRPRRALGSDGLYTG